MIKINLLAEKKQAKTTATSSSVKLEGFGAGQNLILVAILVVGVGVAGFWWWSLASTEAEWVRKHDEADKELERLEEIRKKGEEYKAQKALLAKKIDLITDLKKMQAVPVHILDKVSRNLPDFVWLDSLSAGKNQIKIGGKATTFNAVSLFYNNLTGSGYFDNVQLGRTSEGSGGVSFSLTCEFKSGGAAKAEGDEEPQAKG